MSIYFNHTFTSLCFIFELTINLKNIYKELLIFINETFIPQNHNFLLFVSSTLSLFGNRHELVMKINAKINAYFKIGVLNAITLETFKSYCPYLLGYL